MTVLEEVHEMRPRLAYQSDRDLLRGKRPVLDVICDGILKGTSFEFPPRSMAIPQDHQYQGEGSSD